MDHTQIQEKFSELWEQTLDEETRQKVQAHLDACAACRSDYEAFQQAMRPLGQLGRVRPPQDLKETVPDLIRRRSQGRFFSSRRGLKRVPLEWLSLAMLAVVALLYLLLKLLQPALRLPG
ncbi:MAG: zf-HC2 domain-containing protein [Myxococcales bacterium]|nr:zf-HC2 domain-containing protein [Myxococcota bacterium]MDW8281103.1 zf-HC2 domain-containing protein [Myxococcales bacterium]